MKKPPLKIAAWNVNSIRKRLDIVTDWLDANDVDVLLLQETKVVDDQFPREPFEARGYALALHGQKTFNGVAIASRRGLADVAIGLPGDPEDEQARWIEAVVDGVRVVSLYLPNGTSVGSDKFAFKMRFMDRLYDRFQAMTLDLSPVVIGGDYNVAPAPIDVYDPEECEGHICYHRDERAKLRALTHLGYYDAFRAIHPERRQHSWWDMRGGSWEKGEGLRIDFTLLSPAALDRLIDADIDPKPRGLPQPSDHAPIWCALAA